MITIYKLLAKWRVKKGYIIWNQFVIMLHSRVQRLQPHRRPDHLALHRDLCGPRLRDSGLPAGGGWTWPTNHHHHHHQPPNVQVWKWKRGAGRLLYPGAEHRFPAWIPACWFPACFQSLAPLRHASNLGGPFHVCSLQPAVS